jgi:hypothetical protein
MSGFNNLLSFLGLGWVGTSITVFATLLSIWFYIKGNKRPIPTATRSTRRLVGGPGQALPSNVEIRYDDKIVPRIARTLVSFWNAGNATLQGADIVDKDPLHLQYGKSTKVLSVTVLRTTRSVLGVRAVASPHDARMVDLNFDYLDPQDGALIEILHTGTGSPKLLGTIKGVPKGFRQRGNTRASRAVSFGIKIVQALGLVLIVSTMGLTLLIGPHPLLPQRGWILGAMLLGLVFWISASLHSVWERRTFNPPKTLNETSPDQSAD